MEERGVDHRCCTYPRALTLRIAQDQERWIWIIVYIYMNILIYDLDFMEVYR